MGRKYHFRSRRLIANIEFSASLDKKVVYAPWKQIKNALDLAFGSGDNLHAIWDILYIYSCNDRV